MALKPEVIDAFSVLGVASDVDEVVANRAYKKLALIHHPDRNKGDATSTARFQQIGAAWSICQRHYEYSTWSQVSDTQTKAKSGRGPYNGPRFSIDDEIPLSPEEEELFYRFMFYETLFNRFSRASGQRFRYQRSGRAGGGVYSFSKEFAESQASQESNTAKQRKENEEYERRKRELELDIKAEQCELGRISRENKIASDRRESAYISAFKFGRSGNSAAARNVIEEFGLDVNAPERVSKRQKKTDQVNFQSILHVAASSCDEELVLFLLEHGANSAALNEANLTPFHVAILSGNTPVARFFLARRGSSSEGYHPSKAAPDGRTPLQLAIASGAVSMVELMLKDATVHDVERCWEQASLPFHVKAVLETKRGFVPRDEYAEPGKAMSKKALYKLEVAKKEVARQKEKARRLGEEWARAAENLRKKQERAEKRAIKERLRGESHLVHLLEEGGEEAEEPCRMAEAASRTAAEDVHQKAGQEAHQRAEHETLQRVENEARQRAEHEAVRRKAERPADNQVHRKVEQDARPETDNQARQRLEQYMRNKTEKEGRKKVEERGEIGGHRGPENEACAKREEKSRDRVEEGRNQSELQRRKSASTNRKWQTKDPAAKRVEGLKRLKAQAEEHERQRIGLRETKGLSDVKAKVPVSLPLQDAHGAEAQRRAEQSAEDKARHRHMKGENVRLTVQMLDSPLAPLPNDVTQATHLPDMKTKRPRGYPGKADNSTAVSKIHHQHHLHTTPVISSSAVNPVGSQDASVFSPPHFLVSSIMENLQTCVIPDDLFSYEKGPIASGRENESSVSLFPVARSKPRRRGRGRVLALT